MSEVNKIANYNQMMSWLTRSSTPQTETREEFAKAGFAKATTAKNLKETVPNFLDEKTFVKLRKENKNLTNDQFAKYLNEETDYIPDPRQAEEFQGISIDRRYNAAKKKGLFPKTFAYAGSDKTRLITDKDRAEYKKYAKKLYKNQPEKYQALLNLDDQAINSKISDRRKFLAEQADPEKRQKRLDRKKKYDFETKTGLRGEEAQQVFFEKTNERNRLRKKDSNTFYRNVRDGKTLLWEDLLKRTSISKDSPFKLSKKIIKGKKYDKAETQKFTLTDKNGNKFTFNNLTEDLAKAGYDPQNVLRPYEQKAFLYRENLMKPIIENADKVLGARDNPIHIHHVEGFNKNPFNVQLTFADQNLMEGRNRVSLNATFNNLLKQEKIKSGSNLSGLLNYNRKKQALTKFYDSLGPDIATKVGKKEVGTRPSLIDMLKKKNIKMSPDITQRAMQLGANPMADPSLLKYALQIAGTPLGVAGLTAGFGVDPSSAIDRVALGAEAALAPTLVKGAAEAATTPGMQRILNLGLSPQMAMRVARVAQPIGVASLIGEGLYQLGKKGVAEKTKLDAMTPFQRQQYLASEVEPLMDEGGIVDISREGFDEGGPSDPSKRKFMKIAGGLASIPILGKFFKPAVKVAPAVIETVRRTAEGIPDFISDLIAKVKLKAEATGLKYFTGNKPEEFTDVYKADNYVVTEQGNKTILREVDQDGDMLYKENQIEIEVDPETGGVTYREASARPDAEGKLKDVEEYIEEDDLENMRKYTYDE